MTLADSGFHAEFDERGWLPEERAMKVAELLGSGRVEGVRLGSGLGSEHRKLLLLSALLTAAGLGLLLLYLQRFEREATGGARVQLLTALRPIARGTVIKPEMLGVREVPMSYVEPRAVRATERSKVTGIEVAVDLDPQDGILWTDLAVGVKDRDLASLVQPGNRAVTISARQGGLSGASSQNLIRPGDWVDVIATHAARSGADQGAASVVLLQRVVVLAVGSETERQALRGTDHKRSTQAGAGALTLSVKIEEAQLLSLAAQYGELSVVVRPVEDMTVIEGIPNVTQSNWMQKASEANHRRNAPTDALPTAITGKDAQ